MALSGNSASISLKELFGLFQANAQAGVLTVRDRNGRRVTLYFQDGRLFLPENSPHADATVSSAAERGMSGRWRSLVREVRKATGHYRRSSLEERANAIKSHTDQIEKFLIGEDVSFDFRPGDLPASVQADLAAGRGHVLDPHALLMDSACRVDEVQRIRRFVPSLQLILTPKTGTERHVTKALAKVVPEASAKDIDGQRNLQELILGWGGDEHALQATVALLVEKDWLEPLPAREARNRLRLHLSSDNLPKAAEQLSHLTDIDEVPDNPFSLDLAQELLRSKSFLQGNEVECTLRMHGSRVFSFVCEVFESGAPATLVLRRGKRVKRLAMLPGVLALDTDGTSSVEPIEVYLSRAGKLSVKEIKELRKQTGTLRGAIPARELAEATIAKIVDELADLVYWDVVSVELRNRGKALTENSTALILALDPRARRAVQAGLQGWRAVFDEVPGENPVFIGGPKAKSGDAGAKFFSRFSPLNNVGELRRAAKVGSLPFAKLVAQGLKNGYLARPRQDELLHWIHRSDGQGNDQLTYRLTLAGLSFGYGSAFRKRLSKYQGKNLLPGDEAAFEGDLAGVGLPAVVQILNENKRSGTLVVSAPGDQKVKFYFHRGDLYLLREVEEANAEFLELLLGDEEDEMRDSSVCEGDLSDGDLKDLTTEYLDVLFWDGARFSFYTNDLPWSFFAPGRSTQKVAFKTQAFLLQAVQAMDSWDSIADQVRGGLSVFRFVPGGKLRAIQARDEWASVLTLIDGRSSFDDLVRRSKRSRLDIGQLISELLVEGTLERIDTREGSEPARSGP